MPKTNVTLGSFRQLQGPRQTIWRASLLREIEVLSKFSFEPPTAAKVSHTSTVASTMSERCSTPQSDFMC